MTTELERLVSKEAIVIESTPGTTQPTMTSMRGMSSWDVTLKYKKRRMKTAFFTTPGYQPKAADVISSLCREARSIDETSGSFDTWAKKHGFSTDSRSAYATWEGIAKSTPRLKSFLGRKYKEFATAKHYG